MIYCIILWIRDDELMRSPIIKGEDKEGEKGLRALMGLGTLSPTVNEKNQLYVRIIGN